jgi:hypothetical protein
MGVSDFILRSTKIKGNFRFENFFSKTLSSITFRFLYLKEKESLQFEFHRKYEKNKYSSAAGLPTFNQLQKNKNRLQMNDDGCKEGSIKRRWFESVYVYLTLVITAYLLV